MDDTDVGHHWAMMHAQVQARAVLIMWDAHIPRHIHTHIQSQGDASALLGIVRRRNSDPIIAAIEKRVALWTQLPVSHQEDMQVGRALGMHVSERGVSTDHIKGRLLNFPPEPF